MTPTNTHPPHRVLVGVLLGLATLIGVVAVLAVWTNRQALNTDNWTATSTKLLADEKIQNALAAYTVSELFASPDIQNRVQAALPQQLQGLAGPITGGLQTVAGRVAPRLLASAKVQDAWRTANRTAHLALLKVVDNNGNLASSQGGVVTLDLHAIVEQLGATLGVEDQVSAATTALQQNKSTVKGAAAQAGITLPTDAGKLVILKSDQLRTAEDVAGGIKGLALVLPLLTFGLFALAVFLARGRRRHTIRTVGWCFVGIGIAVLLARRVIGNQVIDSLVKIPSNKPAVHDVWLIGTSLLYNIAVALIAYGLVFIFAMWLAGQTHAATGVRHSLAPTLRDRPAVAYGAVMGLLLIVVAWGPTPATRQIPYIALFALLLILGVRELRRQTAEEFPEAQPGDGGKALRGQWSSRHPAEEKSSNGHPGLGDLERLVALHDHGDLTDAEFAQQKELLIGAP